MPISDERERWNEAPDVLTIDYSLLKTRNETEARTSGSQLAMVAVQDAPAAADSIGSEMVPQFLFQCGTTTALAEE